MLPRWLSGEESACQCRSWEGPLKEEMATHASMLAWEIPWTEERAGYSPSGCKGSDMTERLSTHTHASLPHLSLLSAEGSPHVQAQVPIEQPLCPDSGHFHRASAALAPMRSADASAMAALQPNLSCAHPTDSVSKRPEPQHTSCRQT